MNSIADPWFGFPSWTKQDFHHSEVGELILDLSERGKTPNLPSPGHLKSRYRLYKKGKRIKDGVKRSIFGIRYAIYFYGKLEGDLNAYMAYTICHQPMGKLVFHPQIPIHVLIPIHQL